MGKKRGVFGLWFNPPAEAALGKGDIYFPDYDSYAWSRSSDSRELLMICSRRTVRVKTKHAGGDWKYAPSGGKSLPEGT